MKISFFNKKLQFPRNLYESISWVHYDAASLEMLQNFDSWGLNIEIYIEVKWSRRFLFSDMINYLMQFILSTNIDAQFCGTDILFF